MSCTHPHIEWTCDDCKMVVMKRGYGLPDGWKYYSGGLGTALTHKCAACKKRYEEEQLAAETARLAALRSPCV